MDRREALKRATWLMGGMLSAPAIAGILNGCTAKPSIDWKPVFFTEDQGTLVSQVAEIIIPATDTPGAIDTGVPAFIDQLMKEVYTKEDSDRFVAGLAEFNEGAKKAYGEPFIELEPSQQEAYVKKVHEEAIGVENSDHGKEYKRPFILVTKELTLLGFFTSEPGATKVLQYDAVPGEYKGCVPLSEIGKTWATS
jgi:gluconate 2-dehydrogenase gamma chain